MPRAKLTAACVLIIIGAAVGASPQAAGPPDAGRKAEVERLGAACDAKDMAACFELADLRWNGAASGWREDGKAREAFRKGLSPDPALALATLGQSCETGSARACFRLGLAHEEAADHPKAMQAWQKACGSGDADACYQVAWDLEAGGAQQPGDPAGAAKLHQSACDQGSADACESLAISYAAGTGVAQDAAKAAPLYDKACKAGLPSACFRLAVAYSHGRGVPADTAQVTALLQKLQQACDTGVGPACVLLGKNAWGQNDAKGAFSLAERACQAGEGVGCLNAGLCLRDGKGAPKDRPRAAPLFERACASGDPVGVAIGCAALGISVASGETGVKDLARAASLYGKACDAGGWVGCLNLGVAHQKGTGVAKDDAKAEQFLQRAGALGPAGLGRPYGPFEIEAWSDEEWTTARGRFNSQRPLR